MLATQKIFAVLTPQPGVRARDLLALMQFEAAYVWALYERGTVREIWSLADTPGAVYVLESTPDEASAALAAQPLVRAGLVAVDLAPVAAFTCLADLFGAEPEPVPAAALSAGPPAMRTWPVLAVDRLYDGVSRDDLEPHAAEDARRTWALAKAGLVREAHRRTDRPGAVVVLEVAGLDEARSVVDDLPLVQAGLVAHDLYPLGPFTGLDALMDGAL